MAITAATMPSACPDAGHYAPGPANPLPSRGRQGANAAGKRLFDVVAATVLLVAALPAMIILGAAVAVSLRTWRPLFFQQRIGRGGRPFTMAKLRTLPTSAPRYADKYAIASVTTTRLGRFLRASHLDELPQLALVVSGRMSLVGPRPEMAALLDRFPPAFVAARLSVRPGCTGLWQVSGDADRLIGEAPEYDLYYLRHMSARLDVWVIWQSLIVMSGGAPVSCADVPRWARRRRPALDHTRERVLPEGAMMH